MIIDDGGIYSCDAATDEAINQTLEKNESCDKCKFKIGWLDTLKNHMKAKHESVKWLYMYSCSYFVIIMIIRQRKRIPWETTLKPNI